MIDRAVMGFGGIDVLVNNAQGFVGIKPIIDKPDRDYQHRLCGGGSVNGCGVGLGQ